MRMTARPGISPRRVSEKAGLPIQTCAHCGRWCYDSRAGAKLAARRALPGVRVSVAACPESRYFHYIPQEIAS